MARRILALTRYDHVGASSRVRFLQYIPHLRKMGLEVDVQPLFSNAYVERLYRDGKRSAVDLSAALIKRLATLLQPRGDDVIWLQQEIFPFLPAALERGLLANRRVVIDFDDAYHLYYQNLKFLAARRAFGGKIDALMKRADAVVVGNDTLAAYARAAGARQVHLVYSAVDTRRFADVAAGGLNREKFSVGWIGTPMTAAQSLHILHAPLRQFLAETKAACVLVGVERDQFPDLAATRLPWSEEGEAAFMAQISVGLCPLEDSPWTRGKSGYKIIQYMAAGRPTLTSPVGIASQLVEPGQTGFQCRTADEWYDALIKLHRDFDLCATLGRNARQRAEVKYDTAVAASALYEILNG